MKIKVHDGQKQSNGWVVELPFGERDNPGYDAYVDTPGAIAGAGQEVAFRSETKARSFAAKKNAKRIHPCYVCGPGNARVIWSLPVLRKPQ